MRYGLAVGCAISLLATCSLFAQRVTKPSPEVAAAQPAAVYDTLQQILLPRGILVPELTALPRSTRAQELHLVWQRQSASASPASVAPQLLARVRNSGSFPRLRSLELSEDKLFVAALDASGVLRGWSLIPDPRFVRSEGPGPDGVLTGEIVPVARAEFLVLIPDDGTVAEVRLLQPHRSEGTFTLELVATFPVPAGGDSHGG